MGAGRVRGAGVRGRGVVVGSGGELGGEALAAVKRKTGGNREESGDKRGGEEVALEEGDVMAGDDGVPVPSVVSGGGIVRGT